MCHERVNARCTAASGWWLAGVLAAGTCLGRGRLEHLACPEEHGQRRTSAALAQQFQATAAAQALQAATAEAVAVAKAAEAEKAQAQTAELTRILRASQLASSALLALETKPPVALFLAVEAVNLQRTAGTAPLVQAVQSLHTVLGSTGGLPLAGPPANRTAAALDPDGQWLAVGDETGTIRLWRTASPTAAPASAWQGTPAPCGRWPLPQRQNRLVSAGEDGTIRLWNLNTPETPGTILPGQVGPPMPSRCNAGTVATGSPAPAPTATCGSGRWPTRKPRPSC